MVRIVMAVLGAVLLSACAPKNYLTDPAYLSAWAQAPELNVVCIGEDAKPAPHLVFGPNTCTIAVSPTQAHDVQHFEYKVTLFSRVKVGTWFRPKIDNRQSTLEGKTAMGFAQKGLVNFPMYVPNTNFWEQSGHVFGSTFKVVASLAPAAIGNSLGLPIPAINLEANTEGLFSDVRTAIHDLVENKQEPYAVEVSVRLCGPQLCSPMVSKTLALP